MIAVRLLEKLLVGLYFCCSADSPALPLIWQEYTYFPLLLFPLVLSSLTDPVALVPTLSLSLSQPKGIAVRSLVSLPYWPLY